MSVPFFILHSSLLTSSKSLTLGIARIHSALLSLNRDFHYSLPHRGPSPMQLVVVMAVRKAVSAATITFTATSTIFFFMTIDSSLFTLHSLRRWDRNRRLRLRPC